MHRTSQAWTKAVVAAALMDNVYIAQALRHTGGTRQGSRLLRKNFYMKMCIVHYKEATMSGEDDNDNDDAVVFDARCKTIGQQPWHSPTTRSHCFMSVAFVGTLCIWSGNLAFVISSSENFFTSFTSRVRISCRVSSLLALHVVRRPSNRSAEMSIILWIMSRSRLRLASSSVSIMLVIPININAENPVVDVIVVLPVAAVPKRLVKWDDEYSAANFLYTQFALVWYTRNFFLWTLYASCKASCLALEFGWLFTRLSTILLQNHFQKHFQNFIILFSLLKIHNQPFGPSVEGWLLISTSLTAKITLPASMHPECR